MADKPHDRYSIRRISSPLWRRGQECGLRVHQNLTNRSLLHRHRPSLTVAPMRRSNGGRQGEANLPRTDLLIGPHRCDELIDLTRVRTLHRQVQLLERLPDALSGARLCDSECLGEPPLIDHSDRHRLAVQHLVFGGGLDRMSDRMSEIQYRALARFAL